MPEGLQFCSRFRRLSGLAQVVASVALLLGCSGDRGTNRSRQVPGSKIVPLESRFTPEQTFAFVLPQLAPVEGVGGVRANQCGECHKAIYREWKASSHASALSDLQFQAELYKKGSPRWLCLNCHIPLQNQRRHRVVGLRGGDVLRPALVKNAGFDLALQREAITCAVCHVRRDPKGRSVVIGTRGNAKAPHPVRADPKGLRDSCLRCHDPRGKRITPTLMCWFDTRKEMTESPGGSKRSCVGCHMPKSRRRLAADFTDHPVRVVRQHHWVGGGVPKRYRGYKRLLARGYHPGLAVKLVRAGRNGDKVAFEAELENRRAGHWLTTADPERHLLLIATLRTADGRRQARKRDRIGQVWKWAPRAEKVSDNRMPPGEKRPWSKTFSAAVSAGAVTLELKIWHVRLSTKNAGYMKKEHVRDDYVPGLTKLVRSLERHYPLATLVYREVVDLATGKRIRSTAAQLIGISAAEQRLPMSARDY